MKSDLCFIVRRHSSVYYMGILPIIECDETSGNVKVNSLQLRTVYYFHTCYSRTTPRFSSRKVIVT